MPRMLVASSPVEIESKAEGFSPEAHDTARRMFHELTDRLGRAIAALEVLHEDWPNHRFYFGTEGAEMSALLDGLRRRPDIVDLSSGAPAQLPGTVSGIYMQAAEDAFIGVLVGHENHEGCFPRQPDWASHAALILPHVFVIRLSYPACIEFASPS